MGRSGCDLSKTLHVADRGPVAAGAGPGLQGWGLWLPGGGARAIGVGPNLLWGRTMATGLLLPGSLVQSCFS